LVGALIYRAFWSVLTRDAAVAAAAESKAETRMKYDHYTYLGLQFFEKREFQSAESSFRKSIEYGSDRALAYNNLGSALNAQERWGEAITVLEHALVLDSSLAIARNNLEWARDEKAKQGK
jgi:tetratricopeptide (TPR) repeat protein